MIKRYESVFQKNTDKPNGHKIHTRLTLAFVALLTSCMTGQQQSSQTPAATTTDELVNFNVPSVKPVEAGSETQTQKQLTVSVVPKAFTVSDEPEKDCVAEPEEQKGLLGGFMTVSNGQVPKKPYKVTTQTGMNYEPKLLSFVIKLSNRSEKIMRFSQIYLTLNINSQQVEVATVDVGKLKDAILLGGKEAQFTVSVPQWRANSGEAIIDFKLEGLPIEIDKVNNVVDTGQFNWTFKAQMEAKQARTKKTVENLMLDAAEAGSLHCHAPGLSAG